MNDTEFYQEFLNALEREDKPLCVAMALDALEKGSIDVVGLYTTVLAPALNEMTVRADEQPIAVWKEHIRSAIVRTIMECSYPYLQKELTGKGIRLDKGTVVIVSPSEEYHEIGARMGADFFNLCGYQTIFVGSNTPKDDLIQGIQRVKPTYVVISATNTYSLVNVKKITTALLQMDPDIRILASGRAFRQDPGLCKGFGILGLINTIDDIRALEGEH